MGGKTSTSTQQVAIPASVLAQYQSVNSQAQQTAATPFQTYGTSGTSVAPDYSTGNTGTFVAPVNSEQTTGIAGTNAAANQAQPYYGAATGVLGATQGATQPVNAAAEGQTVANSSGLNGSQINQYLSPYLGDVLGSTEALTSQQNQQAQSGALGTAISSGAFGGDRTGLAAANLQQQEDLAAGNVYSGIANTGYQSALSTAQQEQQLGLSGANQLAQIGQTAYGEGSNTASELAGFGTGAQSAALQGANAQIAAGTVEQQTQQAQDTAQYNQFEQQQSYPFQVDQFLANIAEGTGALSGSTTTTQQPGGFFSDKRLKHDIKKVGKTYDGQPIYSYKMHGDPRTHIGLIAQDVEKKHPDAVGLARGYKTVDYGAATEDAANRGHFYAGGLARTAYAGGGPSIVSPGDLSAILQAQQQMYAPYSNGAGVYGETSSMPHGGAAHIPAPSGGVAHLVTASGGVRQQPTGLQNLSSIMDTASKGNELYSDVHHKHAAAPTDLTPSVPAPTTAPIDPNDTSTLVGPPQRRGGRIGKDGGGDVDGGLGSVLNAQAAMYQQNKQQQLGLGAQTQQHNQLAVANGSPQPASSGSSNLSQTIGLVNEGRKIYNLAKPKPKPANSNAPTDPNNPNTLVGPPQDPPSGLGAAPTDPAPTIDYSGDLGAQVGDGSIDAALPDAASTGASDAAGAGLGDAAGTAAGDAAASGAADAAVTGAADAAVAGGAEVAAADAAAAAAPEVIADVAPLLLAAARRGGKIKGLGYAGGGMPYQADSAGSPYSNSGFDVPDDTNTNTLKTAGPLQKIPTGLQDMIAMGNIANSGSMIGSTFSNEAAARGGLIGRRGYAGDGTVDDDANFDGSDTDPNELGKKSAGLAAAPATQQQTQATSTDDSKPHGLAAVNDFWEKNKGYILPAVSGIAAMGSAPTRSWGTALATGLGAAANTYVPTQQGIANTQMRQAETTGQDIENQTNQQTLDLYKSALQDRKKQQPAAVAAPTSQPPGPAPTNASDIPGYYQQLLKVNPNMTDDEANAYARDQLIDSRAHTNLAGGDLVKYKNRVGQAQFESEKTAQRLYDKWGTVANAPQAGDSAYTNLKLFNPALADAVSRQLHLDPTNEDAWTPAQRAAAENAATGLAGQHMTELHQYTGSSYKEAAGTQVDERMNFTPKGPAAQQFSPQQAFERWHQLYGPTDTGAPARVPFAQWAADNHVNIPPGWTPSQPPAGGSQSPNSAATAPATQRPTGATPQSVQSARTPAFDFSDAPNKPAWLTDPHHVNTQDEEDLSHASAAKETALRNEANSVEKTKRNMIQTQRLLNELPNARTGPGTATLAAVQTTLGNMTGSQFTSWVKSNPSAYYMLQKGLGQSALTDTLSRLGGQGADVALGSEQSNLFTQKLSASTEMPKDAIQSLLQYSLQDDRRELQRQAAIPEYLRQGKDPNAFDGYFNNKFDLNKALTTAAPASTALTPQNKAPTATGPHGEKYVLKNNTWVPQ